MWEDEQGQFGRMEQPEQPQLIQKQRQVGNPVVDTIQQLGQTRHRQRNQIFIA